MGLLLMFLGACLGGAGGFLGASAVLEQMPAWVGILSVPLFVLGCVISIHGRQLLDDGY